MHATLKKEILGDYSLLELIGDAREIGVEPTLSQEIAAELKDCTLRMEALVERLRLIKSDTEVALIRRAARYADLGIKRLLAASYYGATVAEGFAQTRGVTLRIAENMVISIEPGIYLDGIGGLRHSDTVLITWDGWELLTNYPTDIESLTLTSWKPLTRINGWWVRRALHLRTRCN